MEEKYIVLVEPTATGYSALCESEGALTTGRDLEELRANIVEVLTLAVERSVTWDQVELHDYVAG